MHETIYICSFFMTIHGMCPQDAIKSLNTEYGVLDGEGRSAGLSEQTVTTTVERNRQLEASQVS